jgi:hypothetical protein
MAVYNQLVAATITEEVARKQMAKLFGNLVTSTTHESYLVFYGKWHISVWNHAQTDPSKRLADTILATLVLFP